MTVLTICSMWHNRGAARTGMLVHIEDLGLNTRDLSFHSHIGERARRSDIILIFPTQNFQFPCCPRLGPHR